MKKGLIIISIVVLAKLSSGCSCTVIDPGYVGMIMEPEGLTGEVLEPGIHRYGFRSRMILIEKKEMKTIEKLKILCKDDLNFEFDVVVRSRLKSDNSQAIKDILNRQGSSLSRGILKSDLLYNIYIKPSVQDSARAIVKDYETTSIRENRDEIKKEIFKRIKDQTKNDPMEVVAVYLNNFDYPKIITDAMEATKKRQVQIKEQEAQKAVDLLDARTRREVAEQEKATRVAEAQKEAAYNKIVASSVSKEYLQLRRIELELAKVEAQKILYSKVSPGDKVIVIPGTGEGNSATMPIIQTSAVK